MRNCRRQPGTGRSRQCRDTQKTQNNAICVNIGHRGSEVEVAGLEGMEGMKVDSIKRHVDRFVFPHGHGVVVLKSGPVLKVVWATDQIPL